MNFKKPSEKEEEYFMEQELKKRKSVQEEKFRKMKEEEKEELKKLHWMRCPKCGMEMEEMRFRGVEVDKCMTCGGLYLDAGELETLLAIEDSSVMKKLFRIFS